MKVLLKLFPAGHFVIAALFVGASVALVVIGGVQLWKQAKREDRKIDNKGDKR